MTTKAKIVFGTTQEWGTDGTTWAGIPETRGIALPESEVDYQDVTSLDSAGGVREFIPGLTDPGEISIPCNYTTALYTLAAQYRVNKTLMHFRTTLPLEPGQTTGDVFVFRGYVNPVIEQNEVGDPIGLGLTIRVSGQPTYTAGS